MFVRELRSFATSCNSMQLVTKPLTTKSKKKAFFSRGSCWSGLVVGSGAISSLWPSHDPVFTAWGQGASRACSAIINFTVTLRCLPEALWLGTVEAAPQPDPAIGMHSAAGQLHSASTVPTSPCQPPGPAGKTKEKLFPCCLATIGKPSSGCEGEQRRREQAEERKKQTQKGSFCCNSPN